MQIADPSNPQSFECIADASVKAGGPLAATNVALELKPNDVAFGAYPAATKEVNNAVYGMAARAAAAYEWADWAGSSGGAGGIVKLRTPAGAIVCKYASYAGGKLTFVTLGGAAFTWEDQCDVAAYKAIPDFETRAYCRPVSAGNRAPAASTVLEVYSGKTGGKSAGSRGALVAAGAAAVGALAAVALAAA